jgi:hypothetical protein
MAPAALPAGSRGGTQTGMTEARFWEIIGDSAREEDRDRQVAALRASLDKLTASEIEQFDHIFDLMMIRSGAWNLWGAELVANCGASSQGFEHFRRWLISRGEGAFTMVVANPDSLVDVIPEHYVGRPEFEAFGQIARDAWAKKTARNPADMPMEIATEDLDLGEMFSIEPESLKKRYPRLWARFGTD